MEGTHMKIRYCNAGPCVEIRSEGIFVDSHKCIDHIYVIDKADNMAGTRSG